MDIFLFGRRGLECQEPRKQVPKESCTELLCPAPHCTVLHHTLVYTVLHRTLVYTVLHRTLVYTVLHCTLVYCLHCTTPHCNVLCFSALYYT